TRSRRSTPLPYTTLFRSQAGMPPRALRDRVSSAGKGARVHALKASDALVETVGGLADRAIDRVLLTGEPVTSAADGKRLLAGQRSEEHTSELQSRVDLVC